MFIYAGCIPVLLPFCSYWFIYHESLQALSKFLLSSQIFKDYFSPQGLKSHSYSKLFKNIIFPIRLYADFCCFCSPTFFCIGLTTLKTSETFPWHNLTYYFIIPRTVKMNRVYIWGSFKIYFTWVSLALLVVVKNKLFFFFLGFTPQRFWPWMWDEAKECLCLQPEPMCFCCWQLRTTIWEKQHSN